VLSATRKAGETKALAALPLVSAISLTLALLIGGSGDNYPLLTTSAELVSVLLLWYIAQDHGLFSRTPVGMPVKLFVIGLIAVPLIQLIPLPPALWHQLPGKDLPLQLLSLVGLANEWRPISLDPEATIGTALELLPGLAMFFAVLHLSGRDRLRLVCVFIAIALLSAVLGTLQKASGEAETLILFETAHSAYGPGLFVNRNHQAIFLLLGMLMTSAVARILRSTRSQSMFIDAVAPAFFLVFAAGVLATASRTGAILLVPASLASLLILYPAQISWKRLGIGFLLLAILFWVLLQSSAAQAVLERFSEIGEDDRQQYWRDTAVAVGQFWPLGSGLGTFPRLYPTVQSLETVGIHYVNNAHNDWLELVLEAGIAAVALMILFLWILAAAGIRLWAISRAGGQAASLGVAALAGILLLLVHSASEYPLRILSIMATFGLLSGLLVGSAANGETGEDPKGR
jgi:hypothetical protein